ncbi:hypothetical protein PENSPDRAFT_649230 [Peniophora sp. CONT]|nr:hypothetical protein PENSPDRAFT_649230 [Peniophora sp. CONT]
MSASDAKWEALRPWTPRLSLSVREVTSVSATFLLSSLSPNTNLSLILDAQDDQDESSGSSPHILSDSATKGLSVKANGQAWPRVLARLDDDKDEAVVIVYGLLPGIQYDIEFAIVPGDLRMKSHIQTEHSKPSSGSDSTAQNLGHDLPEIILSGPSPTTHASASANVYDASPSPPSSSPPSTPGSHTPTAHTHVPSFDDYLAGLHSNLAHLQSEHDALTSDLKSSRRDTQKHHAALKSDLSALKKASQKHAPTDARMRQKIRALEEATKQAQRGRVDVDEERVALEREYEEGERGRQEVQELWEQARGQADEAREDREKAEEEVDRKLAAARGELAQMEAKLEKLRVRRDRLEGSSTSIEARESVGEDGQSQEKRTGIVPELEARLLELQSERERIEEDPYSYVPPSASTASSSSAHDSFARSHPPGFIAHHTHAHPNMNITPHLNHTLPNQHVHGIPHRGKPHHRGFATRGAFLPSPPRGTAHVNAGGPAVRGRAGARPAAMRRKSSPGEKSASGASMLSSLAPPFEPASVRGRPGTGAWGSS